MLPTAVQQAIASRIDALDAEITQATEVLTSHVSTMNEAKSQVDDWTNQLHVLQDERAELFDALPAIGPIDSEPIEDEEPEQ